MHQLVGKSTYIVFLLVQVAGYFFGFFESHVDVLNHSITSALWFNQTKPLLWNATGFLIPYLDHALNTVFGEFDFYALFMVSVNATALSLMFWSLLKLSTKLSGQHKYLMAIVAWLIIAAPQTLTINSTRIAITGTFSVLLFLGLNDNWQGVSGFVKVLFVLLFTVILSLIRMEAVVLIGAVIGVPLFVHYRWSYKFLSPVVLGLALMVSYNLSLDANAPEAMKMFYYYENELIDRNNVCVEDAYSRNLLHNNTLTLTSAQDSLSLQTTILLHHSLPDTGLLKTSFVSKMLCSESTNPLLDWLFGGVNLESWQYCFQLSMEESKRGLWALLAACVSLLIIGVTYGFHRITFLALALFLVPGLLVFHITLPARFVVPYYTCYSSVSMIIWCLSQPKLTYYSIGFGLIIFSCLFLNEREWLIEKHAKEHIVDNHITEASNIVKNESRFVILQTNSPDLFLPQKVRIDYSPMDSVLFMDEYFTYRVFYKDWELACNCNPKPLTNRLKFAAETDAVYISTPPGVSFSSKYTHLMYNSSVFFYPKGKFGNELTKYQVAYQN